MTFLKAKHTTIKTIPKSSTLQWKSGINTTKDCEDFKGTTNYRRRVLSSNTFKLIGESILSDLTLLVSFLTGCMTMEARPGIQWLDSQKPASKRIKTMSNERGFFHYTSYQLQRKEKAIIDL